MGGSGSGNWYRWDKKTTTESLRRIDIRYLKKLGRLKPGTYGKLSWSSANMQSGSINYRMEKDLMILNYRFRIHGGNWESVEQVITFDRTPCHYGGYRLWLFCPRCRKRMAVLYGAGKYFYCRHCYGLTYSSQQETKPFRLIRKVQKIMQRLEVGDDFGEPLLVKPKNMHKKTFNRLRREAEAADKLSWLSMEQQLGIGF